MSVLDEFCPDCDGPTHEELVIQEFQYGFEGYEHKAMLKATYVAFVCNNPDCGCIISDYRGEMAREAAVNQHLEGIKR